MNVGLLGLGNWEASLALTDLVIITFFPFIAETSLSTMPLQEIMWNLSVSITSRICSVFLGNSSLV